MTTVSSSTKPGNSHEASTTACNTASSTMLAEASKSCKLQSGRNSPPDSDNENEMQTNSLSNDSCSDIEIQRLGDGYCDLVEIAAASQYEQTDGPLQLQLSYNDLSSSESSFGEDAQTIVESFHKKRNLSVDLNSLCSLPRKLRKSKNADTALVTRATKPKSNSQSPTITKRGECATSDPPHPHTFLVNFATSTPKNFEEPTESLKTTPTNQGSLKNREFITQMGSRNSASKDKEEATRSHLSSESSLRQDGGKDEGKLCTGSSNALEDYFSGIHLVSCKIDCMYVVRFFVKCHVIPNTNLT